MTEGKLLSMRFGTLKLFSSFVKIYLFNDMLVFSTRLLTSYRYKGHFLLHSTWLVDLPDTDGTMIPFPSVCISLILLIFLFTAFKNMFQVKSVSSQTYTFCASSTEEKKGWLDVLNKAFAEMQPADKAKRKELQDTGAIPAEDQESRQTSLDEKKSYALQMIIQAASEHQEENQKAKR